MRSGGLKTLKKKLSEYVRLAAGCETVWSPIVTLLLRKSAHRAPAGVPYCRTRCCWTPFGKGG
jgi:hypothetical protein